MSGVEIRQRAASEGQRGGRRGQEGWPAPLHRASWSTDLFTFTNINIGLKGILYGMLWDCIVTEIVFNPCPAE